MLRVAVLGVLLSGAALLSPSPAAAWCRMAVSTCSTCGCRECVDPDEPLGDGEGFCLEWERPCISYSLHAESSSDLDLETVRGVVQRSFDTWLGLSCDGAPSDLRVEETADLAMCDAAEYRSDDGNVNTVAFVDDWRDRDLEWDAYAVTTVFHNVDTGEIYDADLLLNDTIGTWRVCPPEGCADGGVDLENVVTHELGHFFGIGHSTDEEATMYVYSSDPGEVKKRTLEPDDIMAMCTIYPPGSVTGECNFTPRHGLDLDCTDDDEGCGCVAAGAPREGAGGALALAGLAGLLVALRRRRPRVA